ncbi:MAG: hypothetical protein DRG59_06915 [Deltaproteobacteria bacterium]|nr:MAG: hypothetical protein DRG83_10480 [Deltaproteobacteria bacterium]RLB07071.1 MAG: hypothetical protein DRG59_06915 [Deltaproteobacteria bacterium]
MKVIEGGYKKGLWLHDPDAHTQEEIDFLNEAFRRVGKADPRWLKLIWEPKKEKPKLTVVK